MPRKPGQSNRNYPPLTLRQAIRMAEAIQEGASGLPVDRLTLSELLDNSPNSSVFVKLVLASRAYGLTKGGKNATEFSLTEIGVRGTGTDELDRAAAKRQAVLHVDPFRTFFTAYDGKKIPAPAALRSFLANNASVPADRTEECIEHILDDARFAGLLRTVKGSEYVDLKGVAPVPTEPEDQEDSEIEPDDDLQDERPDGTPEEIIGMRPKKVFIAHGKNRTPLDQLKKALDQFKVKYAVAVDEPHKGRPISAKVAQLMREECSSAIFIFTSDERFLKEEDGNHVEVWRPSENVVYELGAASVLYDRRIVIFKEKAVSFPSDFSDLGYIEFEKDQLVAELGTLFSELVALDILEVRAKS